MQVRNSVQGCRLLPVDSPTNGQGWIDRVPDSLSGRNSQSEKGQRTGKGGEGGKTGEGAGRVCPACPVQNFPAHHGILEEVSDQQTTAILPHRPIVLRKSKFDYLTLQMVRPQLEITFSLNEDGAMPVSIPTVARQPCDTGF